MPRFRFQWDNVPLPVRNALALHLQIPADTPQFVRHFGKRPREEFIQVAWDVLQVHWLSNDQAATQRIVSQLRDRGNGDPQISADMAFLASCRNTIGLRRIVLAEFIALGETGPTDVTLPGGPESAPAVLPQPAIPTAATLPIHEQLRQFLIVHMQKHYPADAIGLDDDGSITVTAGSASVFVSVHAEPLFVRIAAVLVHQLTATPELFETLNHVNRALQIGRMYWIDGYVIFEECLLAQAINEASFIQTLEAVRFIADQYDDRLHATFGGTMMQNAPTGDSIDV
jgi:hypothetical protein